MESKAQEAPVTGLYQEDSGIRGPGEAIPQEAVPKVYPAEVAPGKWEPVHGDFTRSSREPSSELQKGKCLWSKVQREEILGGCLCFLLFFLNSGGA